MMVVFLLTFSWILLTPSLALAWGPITHLSYGVEILNNLPMLIHPLQELLRTFPNDFLYGCIAADITLKKDAVDFLYNCHNWDVGLHILEKAKTRKQKAFAYGYLSHLAADTISHNYFVPYHITASFPTKTLKHVYWELRFDATRDKKFWKMAKHLAKTYHKSTHDELLKGLLKRTLFSFRTNKFIFNSLMHLEHSESWRKLVSSVSKKSTWKLPPQDIKEFHSLAVTAMIDFLNHGKKSKFYRIDPSGKAALMKAKKLRKQLKKTHKHQTKKEIETKLFVIKESFKRALFANIGHPLLSSSTCTEAAPLKNAEKQNPIEHRAL